MMELIMNDILGTPAILIGLFALAGLLLQKKISRRYRVRHLENNHGFFNIRSGRHGRV